MFARVRTCALQQLTTSPKKLHGEQVVVRLCAPCGYDLRGTPDKDGNCPECGERFTDSQFLLSSRTVDGVLDKLEGRAVAGVGVFVFCVATGVSAWMWGPRSQGIFALCLAMLWAFIVGRYGYMCEWQHGWRTVVLLFHLIGSIGAALIAIAWLCSIKVCVEWSSGTFAFDADSVRYLVGIIGSIIALPLVIRPLYRRAKMYQVDRQRDLAARGAMSMKHG